MTAGREERIRARAYELWELQGRPPGREGENWEQAEREIDGGLSTGQEYAGEQAANGGGSQMSGSNFDERLDESTSVLGSESGSSSEAAPAAPKRGRRPKAPKG